MGQIRQNAEAKTEFGPPSSDRALYSDKARSFNQSERALYLNFIIKYSTVQYSTVQCSAVQYSTVHHSTVQYSAVQCSTVQCTTVHYSTLQYSIFTL